MYDKDSPMEMTITSVPTDETKLGVGSHISGLYILQTVSSHIVELSSHSVLSVEETTAF